MKSEADVEYFALDSAVQESVWMGRVFDFAKKLSVPPETVIKVENQCSITIAKS